jgi:hypothetical protein
MKKTRNKNEQFLNGLFSDLDDTEQSSMFIALKKLLNQLELQNKMMREEIT